MTKETLVHLAALADHLAGKRDAIMQAWRAASEADPEQTTVQSLTRTQFNDHMPEVLDAFERKLSASQGGEAAAKAEEDQRREEVKHGSHRWQQGYGLRELMREWGHIHLCLSNVLEAYAKANSGTGRNIMAAANNELIKFINGAISESTEQFLRLEREEAAGRARDLEQALAEFAEMERQRNQLIRQAVHDLGGNVQAVSSAASILGFPQIPEADREQFSEMLRRGVEALRGMMGELMDLARLEAGEETPKVTSFDASKVLTELCVTCQPLATQRRLALKVNGPDSLPVEGDAEKMRRIVQNLVHNALKYTERGEVAVSWGEEGDLSWWVKIKDTGPGILRGPGAPMVAGLRQATASARESDEKAEKAGDASIHILPDTGAPEIGPAHQKSGEGIGLSIVKRLCELLNASLEVSSSPQGGTAFRVLLPKRYDKPK